MKLQALRLRRRWPRGAAKATGGGGLDCEGHPHELAGQLPPRCLEPDHWLVQVLRFFWRWLCLLAWFVLVQVELLQSPRCRWTARTALAIYKSPPGPVGDEGRAVSQSVLCSGSGKAARFTLLLAVEGSQHRSS